MNYSAEIECENCGYRGPIEIPEGLKISEMPCPECQTKSLSRAKKEETPKPKEAPEEK